MVDQPIVPLEQISLEHRQFESKISTGTDSANKMSSNEERTQGLLPLFVAAEIIGLFSVILMLYWCIALNQGFGFSEQPLFNWHPFFMTIGLIYLMGNAILIFRVFRNTHKKVLKLLHGGINAAGLFFTALAVISVIVHKGSKPHFYTMHAWIGIVAVVLYAAQLVFGGAAYLFNMVSNARKAVMLPYHVFFGHLIFVLGIAAAVSGLNEKAIWKLDSDYALRVPTAWVMNLLGILFILFGSIVVYMSTNTFFRRYPRPEDSELLSRNSE